MFKVEINDDAVASALARLSTDLGDLSDPMDDIGAYLAYSSRDRIDSGISPDGTPFAPRSQTTLNRYAKENKSFKGPLHQSGGMRQGIFHQYGPSSVEVGSNAIQAAVMQFGAGQGAFGKSTRGGPIPWGNIPARPFLGISDDDLQAIPGIIDDWFASLPNSSAQ
uniref:phage virion morphogenesis protein n=1 Tax=Yoonia sp. TaxID=2212373 RepID=UPI0040487B76